MKSPRKIAQAALAEGYSEARQGRADAGLTDHRATATAQFQRQQMADASTQTRQLMAVRQMAATAQLDKRTKNPPKHDRKNGIRKPRNIVPRKPDNPIIESLAPPCQIKLHIQVVNEIQNYAAWLRDEVTWVGRTDKVKEKRREALDVLRQAEDLHKQAAKDYPNQLLARWTRRRSLDYTKQHAGDINDEVDEIRNYLALIDTLVKEPPVPPKSWSGFMGSPQKTYHTGSSGDPIPVVWYKNEADYEPIKTKKRTYNYPDGPTVLGRLGTHVLKVDPTFRFKLGSVFQNDKMTETRKVQVDINSALKLAGADLSGLDGDHVRDLGFGGVDKGHNYWPLVAKVNRRPFLGWRSNYGVNYISSSGNYVTAALGALAGKYLKIKAFMGAGDGNVPAEGVRPDPKAGTDEL